MFQMVRRKLHDIRTLAKLCTLAEEIAREQGRAKPGSEHFVLSALALPDQTVARAFRQLGITEERFKEALHSQRVDALKAVGVSTSAAGISPHSIEPRPKPILYEAEPSGQDLVKRLTDSRRARRGRTLLGADVLLAASQESFTPSSRAFQRLGVSTVRLADAANQAIASSVPPDA